MRRPSYEIILDGGQTANNEPDFYDLHPISDGICVVKYVANARTKRGGVADIN